MGLEKSKFANKVFAIVISDGTIRVKAEEGQPEVVKREYETSDGKKGVKFEKIYNSLSGIISKVDFRDGEYGMNLEVNIDGITLSVNVESNFGQDIMKKLPNIDIIKPVIFTPYSFTADNGKTKKGMSVNQEGKKLTSFFHDKKLKALKGFPEPGADKATYGKDEWKVYFIGVKKFLVKYTRDNIIPNFPEIVQAQPSESQATGTFPNTELETEEETLDTLIANAKSVPFQDKDDNARMLEVILQLAKDKLGAVTADDSKQKVMEATGLYFSEPNYLNIIEKLSDLPIKGA